MKESKVFMGYSEIRSARADAWEASRSGAYRRYREKWIEYPEQGYIPDFPLHIDLESTTACNLLCPMCLRTILLKKRKWPQSRHMDFAVFKKCIDEGAEKGLCAVNLNNYGEPLLHPRIVEMVSYAKQKGILDVFFHTNAVLLSRETAERLIEAGLDRLVISVDYPYKEKFESIRVGADFEQVLENIRNLQQAKIAKRSTDPLTRINMIRFPDLSAGILEDMKQTFGDLVDVIGFLEYQESDEEKLQKPCYPQDYRSEFSCPQLITRLTVLADGTVVPCCVGNYNGIVLGSVMENSLEELWKGKKLAKLRGIHDKGRFFRIPACSDCSWAIEQDKKLAEASGSTGPRSRSADNTAEKIVTGR